MERQPQPGNGLLSSGDALPHLQPLEKKKQKSCTGCSVLDTSLFQNLLADGSKISFELKNIVMKVIPNADNYKEFKLRFFKQSPLSHNLCFRI